MALVLALRALGKDARMVMCGVPPAYLQPFPAVDGLWITRHVDETFDAYKEDGRWDETYEKWIGQYTDTEADPPDISVEEAVELVKQNEA